MSKKEKYSLDEIRQAVSRYQKRTEEDIRDGVIMAALMAKYGRRHGGLLCLNPYPEVTEKEIEETVNEVLPYIKKSSAEAYNNFTCFLGNKDVVRYLSQRPAELNGKKGAEQRTGTRKKHLEWLEEIMTANAEKYIGKPPTAEEHFEEIRSHPDIDADEDDERLYFKIPALERMGYDPDRKTPAITLHVVRETLTRINKKQKSKIEII